MPGSRTQKQASSHPSRRESSRTSLPCALQSRTLGQTARSKGRLRNSNLSNDKCMGARKLTFSKHDCSVQHDPRRRHQTCVRAKLGRLFTVEEAGHQARSRGIDVGAVITKALTAAGLMK